MSDRTLGATWNLTHSARCYSQLLLRTVIQTGQTYASRARREPQAQPWTCVQIRPPPGLVCRSATSWTPDMLLCDYRSRHSIRIPEQMRAGTGSANAEAAVVRTALPGGVRKGCSEQLLMEVRGVVKSPQGHAINHFIREACIALCTNATHSCTTSST